MKKDVFGDSRVIVLDDPDTVKEQLDDSPLGDMLKGKK